MKQIIVHQEKCTACRECELACSFSHTGEFNPALSRIRVNDFYGEQFYLPMTAGFVRFVAATSVPRRFRTA